MKRTTSYSYLSIGDDLAKGHTPFDTYNISYTDILYDYLKIHHKNATLDKNFIKEDLRIKDLIEMIKNPNLTSKETLSNALKNADLITLSVGSDELFSKLRSSYNINKTNYKYADSMINEIKELLKEIRKITNKRIYIIGYYNPIKETEENSSSITTLFNYLNTSFINIEKEYNIKYIRIDEDFRNKIEFLPNQENAFPSTLGYTFIANKIIKKIES